MQSNWSCFFEADFEEFLYDGAKHYSIASFSREFWERTITVNALSKTYAMTGWRVGYAVGFPELIKAISSLQSQVTGNVNSVAQKAPLAALQGSQACVKRMVRSFDKRRRLVLKRLRKISDVSCVEPRGAFYVFPYMEGLYGNGIKDSVAFSAFLLERAHVALVPGEPFGDDSCLRLSYALPLERLREGIERLGNAIEALETI